MFGDGTDPLGFPITVTGAKTPAPPPVTGPTEAATPAGTPVAEAPKKKHIWQDVLGAIGDAMLAQGGSPAQYAPFKDKRDIGDAMQGFDKDPVGTIKQVSKLDPALGERMLNNYQEGEIRKDAQAYADMAKKRDDELARLKYEDGVYKDTYAMLRNPNIAQSYGKVLPQMKKYLTDHGVDAEKLGLPDTYDPDIVNSLLATTRRAMDEERLAAQERYRDEMIALRRERLGQTGANTASQIADRATDNGRADQAQANLEKQRQWQRDNPSKGGGGRRPPPAAAAPAGKKYDDNKMYTNSAGVTKSGKELNAMAQ